MNIAIDSCRKALATILTVAIAGAGQGASAQDFPVKKLRAYVGTYSKGKSKGIYRFDLDAKTGGMSAPLLAAEAINPSFLAIHPSGKFLYAANEIGDYQGGTTGAVSAFVIETSGDLKLLNQESSGGGGPCHVVVDKAGRNLLVANYGGGSAGVLGIDEFGKLSPMTSFVQHAGAGAVPARQAGPHAHSANLDAANRFAFVADLGLDQILVYRFDGAKHAMTPNDPPSAKLAPGSGPRHFAFHPGGRFAFVINELANTVTAFAYDAQAGVLKEVQTIGTLPAGYAGRSSTAEVQVHPSGKFLYGSNRGHDSLAIFAIDQNSGQLTAVGHQGEGIKTPRNFGIDPSGQFVIVANQGANSVIAFRVDPTTGRLQPTGGNIEIGSPVCVKFMP